MRNKSVLLISTVLVLVLAMSGCQSKQSNPRTLSVTGSSQAFLTPDVAYVSIGVHTENANASEAISSNNAGSQQVIDAIKGQGVEAKDIRTSNFSIYPQQQYDEKGKVTGTLYVVDNTVYVTLRDMTTIGQVLDASTKAGANSVYGIQFDVLDKTAPLAEARQAAVENAHTQAESLAQAAGAKLGSVQSISFYNSYPTTVMVDGKGGGASMSSTSVPVSAGQVSIQVDVNLTYEIR
jgi:uncharacterized protein YggE